MEQILTHFRDGGSIFLQDDEIAQAIREHPEDFFALSQASVKRQFISCIAKNEKATCANFSSNFVKTLRLHDGLLEFSTKYPEQRHVFFENVDILNSCAGDFFTQEIMATDFSILDVLAEKMDFLFRSLLSAQEMKEANYAMHVTSKVFLCLDVYLEDLKHMRPSVFQERTNRMLEVCIFASKLEGIPVSIRKAVGLVFSVLLEAWESVSVHHKPLDYNKPQSKGYPIYYLYLKRTSTSITESARQISLHGVLCIIQGCLHRFLLNANAKYYAEILMNALLQSETTPDVDFYSFQIAEVLFSKLAKQEDTHLASLLLDVDTMKNFEVKFYETLEKDPFCNKKLMEKILSSFYSYSQKHFPCLKQNYQSIIENISWRHAFKYTALELFYANNLELRMDNVDSMIVHEAIQNIEERKITSVACRLLVVLLLTGPKCLEMLLHEIDASNCSEERRQIVISKVLAPLASKGKKSLDEVLACFAQKPLLLMKFLTSLDKRTLKKVKLTASLLEKLKAIQNFGDFPSRLACIVTLLELQEFRDDTLEALQGFLSHNTRPENVSSSTEINSFLTQLALRNSDVYVSSLQTIAKQLYPAGSLERRYTLIQLLCNGSADSSMLAPHTGLLISCCFENWPELRNLAYKALLKLDHAKISESLVMYQGNLVDELNSVKQKWCYGAGYVLALLYQSQWNKLSAEKKLSVTYFKVASWQGRAYCALQESIETGDFSGNSIHGILFLIRLLMPLLNGDRSPSEHWTQLYAMTCIQSIRICITLLEAFVGSCDSENDERGLDYDCRGHIVTHQQEAVERQVLSAISWLSLKEAADLLKSSICGYTETLPPDLIRKALWQLVRTILVSKHNGVISKCQLALKAISQECLSSTCDDLVKLPKGILTSMFGTDGISSKEGGRTLRRSQGLPFVFSALLESEQNILNKQLFPMCLKRIQEVICESDVTEEANTGKIENLDLPEKHIINSLNVLRQILSNNVLRAPIGPYIETLFKAIFLGLRSDTWAIRNSFIMTFAQLLGYMLHDNPMNRPCIYDMIEKYPGVISHASHILESLDPRNYSFSLILFARLKPVDVPSERYLEVVRCLVSILLTVIDSPNQLARHQVAVALRNLVDVHPTVIIKLIINKFMMITEKPSSRNAIHTLLVAMQKIAIACESCVWKAFDHPLQERILQVMQRQCDISSRNQVDFLVECVACDLFLSLAKNGLISSTLLAAFLDVLVGVGRQPGLSHKSSVAICHSRIHYSDFVAQSLLGILSMGNESQFTELTNAIIKLPNLHAILEAIQNEELLGSLMHNEAVRSTAILNCRRRGVCRALRLYYEKCVSPEKIEADFQKHISVTAENNIYHFLQEMVVTGALGIEWSLKREIIRFLAVLHNKKVCFGEVNFDIASIVPRFQEWSTSSNPLQVRLAVAEAILDIDSAHEIIYHSKDLCEVVTLLLIDCDQNVRHTIAAALSDQQRNIPHQDKYLHAGLQSEVALERHFLHIYAMKTSVGHAQHYLKMLMPDRTAVTKLFEAADPDMGECSIFDHEERNFYIEPILVSQYIASVLRSTALNFPENMIFPDEADLRAIVNPVLDCISSRTNMVDKVVKRPDISEIWSFCYMALLMGWTCFHACPSILHQVCLVIGPILESDKLKNLLKPELRVFLVDGGNAAPHDVCFLLSQKFLDTIGCH